jgi:hypothetical protein
MAARQGNSLYQFMSRLIPVLMAALLFAVPSTTNGQEPDDTIRLRSITPPMVDPASMGTRWAIWRDADGADSERAFDAFLQIAHELGYWELESYADAILAEQAMLSREQRPQRLVRARRLSPDSPALAWAIVEDVSREKVWALHEVLPSAWHATRLTLDTSAGRVLTDHFVADLLSRSLLYLLVIGAGALWWKTWARLAFDLRLLLVRVPTWRQAQAIVWLGASATALFVSPLIGIALLLFVVAAYAGRRDVPTLVAMLVAGTIYLAPPSPPMVDVASAELYERASARPCGTTCVQQLEAGVARGSVAATMSLAWVEYRLGTTSHRERAAQLLAAVPADAFPYARALLTGHLALVDGSTETADAAYRTAFQNARGLLERGAAGVSLYRTSNLLDEREVAREMALEASYSGHPWTEEWRNDAGRSQNTALPILPLDQREVLRTTLGESWDSWWLTYRPWESPDVPVYWGSTLAGLLLALVLSRTKRRSEACRVCSTPTNRLVLAEAYDQHNCVWCYQQTERTLRMEFEQRHAREYRAYRRAAWRRWTRRVLALVVPGFSGLSSQSTVSGLVAAVSVSLAVGAWTTTAILPTSVLIPAPNIWWMQATFWAPALLGFGALVSLGGTLFAQRREDV